MKLGIHNADDLAIFGAEPLFATPRPIGQLSAPDADGYLSLIRDAYARRRLTDGGPIAAELERRLAAYHGTAHCVTIANAGLAMIMLTHLFAKGKRGEVIMPAFSYRGLPHIVQWARQLPRFCDVDAATHTLDPSPVEWAVSDQTTSILAVCNFNSPGDIDALCSVAARHRLPIMFDSVDALGSTYRRRNLGANGDCEIFSAHATKMLNGFEGGYVTTNDGGIAAALRWQRDSGEQAAPDLSNGFRPLRLRAPYNELHAAMALLSLEQIGAIIAANQRRARAYQAVCRGLRGFNLVPYGDADGERSNYRMVVAEISAGWRFGRDRTIAILRAEGAAIDAYWSPALHRSVHCPEGTIPPSLPVAEALGQRMLHLPVGELTSVEDISRIGELLWFLNDHVDEILTRLSDDGAHT